MPPSASTWTRAGPAAALVVLVVAAAGAYGLARAGDGGTRQQLPDLVQRTPYALAVQTVRTPRGARHRLGFASAVDNLGSGPLIVVGRRPTLARETMVADQLIERSDGSTLRVRRVGTLRYTRSVGHEHWHYLGFDRYSLLAPDGSRARRDRKTGFCLGDRYDARPAERLPGDPGRPVRTGECGRDRQGLRALNQGISVGYGDDYDPILEGQFLDVTRLPAGRYELLHWANSNRRVRETRYDNNAASVIVEIRWPRGFARPPSVDVVQRCGDGNRCEPRR